MIIYFIIIILLVIIYNKYTPVKSESFGNYKSLVITPNKLVYSPYKINANNTIISQYIANFLTQKFPIIKNTHITSNYNIITKDNNGLTITTLYDFIKYSENNNDTNMRFIMHLFNQKLTIISRNKNYNYLSDIKNDNLYVYSKNSSEFYILNILKKYYKFNIKIIYGNKYITNLIKLFNQNNKINNIAIFTNHPNIRIVNLIKSNSEYKILGIDNIDNALLRNSITNFKTDSIDSNIYYKYRNDMIKTLVNPIILICHKNIDAKFIESIMEYVYKNFILIKKSDDPRILDIVKYFNLYNIFSGETNLYEIHNGIINFYRKRGYISEKDLNICRKVVSIKSCSDEIRLNPYRLL